MAQNKDAAVDLSIIVTAHAEGILLHKTLASISRALVPFSATGSTHELIIHCDNATPSTESYLKTHEKSLRTTAIYRNSFGDLGSSRNFAVQHAKGKYVSFIDADDLMSELWLIKAYEFLEDHEFGKYIAHTEKTVEFGGADSVIIKHGETNQATDTLLSVYANRWNSIIIAPRHLLLEEPYTKNSAGFGYEDWHLNCRWIYRGIHNVLIPETVIFVRRKATQSEWARQIDSRAVLQANSLLAFDNIRQLPKISWEEQPETQSYTTSSYLKKAKALLRRMPKSEKYARKAYHAIKGYRSAPQNIQTQSRLPGWLLNEWRAMHSLEKLLFPSDELVARIPIYDSFSADHIAAARCYQQLVKHTSKNRYDYVIFVPWLIKGGADKVTINYAVSLLKLHPGKSVGVIATLPVEATWAEQLPAGADFIPFGLLTQNTSREIKHRLLEQFIENSGARYLHIINSELGYDFVESHETYIRATGKKVIATSFSQSTDSSGRVFGYSHTHVPKVYELSTRITTDNQAVVDMWVNEYGFDAAKLLVHHQPLAIPRVTAPSRPLQQSKLRLLWAARISYEKQPELVPEIAKALRDLDVTIDMYGTITADYDPNFVRSLPPNVTYKGEFDGFFTLPHQEYDAFLYTSLFDGMPNAILEAAAVRLPIISSAVGGVPNFITNTENGLLVQDIKNPKAYADSVKFLYEHSNLLATFSERLHAQLQKKHSAANYDKEIQGFLQDIEY